jgi:hypothetical protein
MRIDIALLKRQHAAIIVAADDFAKLLSGPYEAASDRLAIARSTLARLIAEHLKTEGEQLHAPLQAHQLTSRVASYAPIAAQTRDLRLAYSTHISTWRQSTIERDWAGYVIASQGFCRQLKEVLAREERDLFPAAQALLTALR